MKLPVTFEQFIKDPVKGLMFLSLAAMSFLYIDARNQMKEATKVCENRLIRCETELKKMAVMLKTQDSVCSALTTEIRLYKELGKI